MKKNVIMILFIFTITAIILPILADADKEPNDSFRYARELNEGSEVGNVYVGFFDDIDVFYIESPDSGNIKIDLKLLSQGSISMSLFDSTNENRNDELSIILNNKGDSGSSKWVIPQEHEGIYARIEGSGEYRITADYTEQDTSDIFFSPTVITLIVVGIAIGSIIMIASVLFLKATNIRSEEGKFEILDNNDGEIAPEAERVDLLSDGIPDEIDEFPLEAKMDLDDYSDLKHSVFE